MPPRLEGDLDLGVSIDRPFELGVQLVDADCVPIADGRRFPRPVPRPQRPIASNFDQLPSAHSGAEALYSKEEPVVTRLRGSPQLAFLSEQRMERLVLRRTLQPERLPLRGKRAGEGRVPEESNNAWINGIVPGRRVLVAGCGEDR